MSVTYRKMWGLVHERGYKWEDIRKEIGISSKTVAKINKNQYVSLNTLEKIALFLNCDIGDLVEIHKDSK